ncbi:cholecystokinin receptor type A-like [Saccostrea echinata]|uniref:cholecystokinin receptor type A-like n=1 Tax=Saccostrea echinata TaxID=191078 RepID=UPI002A7F3DE2|nr:cholecystokinin receptor type A-like [Saccostrea echinata]
MDNETFILEKLEKWNRELAESLIIDNVILSLYIIVGLLGNSTVISIYGFVMKGDNEDRYFIPFLAAVDLCTCLLGSSFGIALNVFPVKFENEFACKVLKSLVPFFTFTSVLFLLIIAVHRYLKVCKPFGKQMTLKWKQFSMCLASIIALVLSLPMIYFYRSVSIPNTEEGIVGWRCSASKSANKTLSLIYGGVLLIATIIIIISLVILYSSIGYTILVHFNNAKTINKKKNCSEEENSNDVYKLQNPISSQGDPHSKVENKTYSSKTDIIELSGNYSIPQTSPTTTGKICNKRTTLEETANHQMSSATQQMQKRNRAVVHKFTLMFMLITVIFFVCYIPKVILLLLEARNPKFWEELSDSARAGVVFVYRMYIINNITNPFIYAFLDNKFATEIKKLIKMCR